MTPIPTGGPLHEQDVPGRLPHPTKPVSDPVVQSQVGAAAPTPGAGFDGLGQGFTGPAGTFSITGVPPDPNSAVGTTQLVQIVNSGFAVFTKSGTVTFGPANTNTLFTGFGGPCETTDDGDGIVRYDSLANRWVITQFANVRTTGPFFECVAVSQTSDATGAYNRYSFQFANFPDYPKLSVWPDAYYVTYNLFNAAGTAFLGADSCAMNRAAMLAGTAATQQCFTTSTSFGGIVPADVDGTTAPPAGAPNLQVALGTTSTTLAYWKFHVDFATPANSSFAGPTNLTVAAYTPACGASGTCVPQSGTTQQLDSLSDRLMFRLAYRNFGDHQALVSSQSVTVGTSVGERWYEFRLDASGNPTVFQQSTYAPDATFRWLGSTAMDSAGNMALGYSASSSALHPGIRYTGRLAGDPLGQMTQGETIAITGAGSQTAQSRWGDYSSMSVDPTNGCTFWYTHEYIPANGSFNWKTRNVSFALPGCGAAPVNDFSIAVSPASGSVTAGQSTTTTVSTAVTSGAAGTVTMSASGLPAGATASFSPASVMAGGSSTLTISTTTATPAGSSTAVVTGVEGSATHSASYALTVNPVAGNIVTVTNPGSRTGTVGTATSLQITATDSAAGQTLTYSATGLPTGLSINATTGLISGTPSAAGTFTTTATARDTTGASGSATFTWTISPAAGGCTGQLFKNPGFESGATSWAATAGVINTDGAHSQTGTGYAWLDGYGTTHTDTLSQSVTIPAGCHATITYALRITSAETTTTTPFDTLTLAAGTTTLQSFSNLNKGTTFVTRTADLSAFAGQTVTLKWTGREDVSLATSFFIDNTAVTLS